LRVKEYDGGSKNYTIIAVNQNPWNFIYIPVEFGFFTLFPSQKQLEDEIKKTIKKTKHAIDHYPEKENETKILGNRTKFINSSNITDVLP
jgi:hypothetical protein